MATANRFRLIAVGLAVFSIYIGIEIDYRHPTWVLFLILIPTTLGILLILTRRKGRPDTKA